MRNTFIRKGLAGVMGLFIASSSLVAVTATAAHAATGNVKICKTLTTVTGLTLGTSPVFTYNVTGVENAITVAAGTCSLPFSVPTGTQTVTEVGAPWFSVASITALSGSSYLGTVNLKAGTAQITVSNTTDVDVLTYTNSPVTGYVEVCKQAATGSGLTGTYAFTITGPDGFTAPASAGVNNCSPPVLVPVGTDTVTEAGTNLYVTGITADSNGVTTKSELAGTPNLITGTATVTVAATPVIPNDTTQTDVTYTNNVVAFEVCKTWDSATTEPGGSTTLFPYTFSASGPAGPNTAPVTVSLQAGQCSFPTYFRPGTSVTVTEGIVPGTKVETIATDGNAESVVPGTLSITGRTVTIIVGTPTTSTMAPTNDAIVTFKNEAALPGTLKICKTSGTVAPVGTSFNFTVSGAPGTTAVTLGDCAFVLGANSLPMQFPFNSTQLVTETGSTGNAASAITATPTTVIENVAGVPTLTSESVTVPSTATVPNPNLGSLGTASSISVVIGEATLTEAMFTDIDPPATVTPATVSIPGGSDLGTTTAANQAIAQAVASSSSVIANAKAVAAVNPVAVAATAKLSPSQKKALLRHDDALLKSVNAKIAAELVKVAHTKGSAHKTALTKLAKLRAQQRSLKHAIKNLK